MRHSVHVTIAVAIASILGAVPPASGERTADVSWRLIATACESLATTALAKGQITSAAVVPAGAFRPPNAASNTALPAYAASLPAFCRVAATLTPTSDSDIKIEVW